MKLSFRAKLDADATPDPNQIFLQPTAEADRQRPDLAALVIQRGIGGFRHGAGPLDTVVLSADPCFDDLLAASFILELLAGRALPGGAGSFARYSGLQREGLSPGSMPPEASLEGVFLAIRNAGGGKLLEPAVAERFETDWFRMAAVILRAAEKGQDSFSVPLFNDGPEFARERTFLANDRILFRQDLQRGEQWMVTIPGGPPKGRALVLRQPKSLLFKQWSRREEEAHPGEPFVLLLVDWGQGHWVCSTDPVRQLSLETLFSQLQQAEVSRDADRAKRDPWVDPPRFNHTLVAAPRDGTRLADADVLKQLRRWSHAKSTKKPLPLGPPLAVAATLCIVVAAYFLWPKPNPKVAMRSSLEYLEAMPSTDSAPLTRDGKDFALLIASNAYSNGWPTLSNAESDATTIGDVLEKDYAFEVDRSGMKNTRDQFAAKIMDYRTRKFGTNDQLLIYIGGHGERIDGRGYLVFKDSADSRQHQTSTYYSLADLREDVALIGTHCPHVFLVLDTCFGGMMDFDAVTEEVHRGSETHAMTARPKNVIFERKMKNRCCAFLASVGKTTASDGRAGTHSPFANTIINLLQAAHPGDLVTIPSIATEVDKDPAQEPRYALLKGTDPGGDFVFLRRP
jgi:hypothetical protein